MFTSEHIDIDGVDHTCMLTGNLALLLDPDRSVVLVEANYLTQSPVMGLGLSFPNRADVFF